VVHPTRAAHAVIAVLSWLVCGATPSADRAPVTRVRSESPALADAIARGTTQSATFRRLVEDIDATDGLVYVLEGHCGEGVRACLHMSVDLAGQYRLLRVLVNPRRAPGCELIGSIGHELQHALEALRNSHNTTGFALSSFFHQIGSQGTHRFETPEAIAAGLAVEREVCNRGSISGSGPMQSRGNRQRAAAVAKLSLTAIDGR
jgi:hypothetical protein